MWPCDVGPDVRDGWHFVLAAMVPGYLLGFLQLSTTDMGFVFSAIGWRLPRPVALPAISDIVGRKMAAGLMHSVRCSCICYPARGR